jgi:hypothetical protein
MSFELISLCIFFISSADFIAASALGLGSVFLKRFGCFLWFAKYGV